MGVCVAYRAAATGLAALSLHDVFFRRTAMTIKQRITPFLWFDKEAEEAADCYISIFKNSRITGVSRYGEAGPGPKGSVMTVAFELDGQALVALNGGPLFKFTEAISMVVNCETQAEVDHYWDRLSAGGQPGRCGWLKDRFGMSWQVVPTALVEMVQDTAKSPGVMAALMQMDKLDIEQLQQAYRG
jgi:predicted 3-demethylubiquinone-9 3-methyltransferase (glyoxalase superfamily)